MVEDNYKLEFDKNINGMSFRGDNKAFLFDLGDLHNKLLLLNDLLSKPDLCTFDLMEWPLQLFGIPPLSTNPDSAKWFYKIIETWAIEYNSSKHNNLKTEQIRIFLSECKEYLKLSSRPEIELINRIIKEEARFNEFFKLDFISLLLSYALTLNHDNSMNENFINGLVLLPQYYENPGKNLKALTKAHITPTTNLIISDLNKGAKFYEHINPLICPVNEFYFFGIHFPFPREIFIQHIQKIFTINFSRGNRFDAINQWIEYKLVFCKKHTLDGKKNSTAKGDPELSLSLLALYHVFTDQVINDFNKHKKAQDKGFESVTSGVQLLRRYRLLRKKENRLFDNQSFSKRKLDKRIDLYKKLIVLLEKDGKANQVANAKRELNELKIRRYDETC